jgi:hypothetical protein
LLRDEFKPRTPQRTSVSDLVANVRRLRRRRTGTSIAAALSVIVVAALSVLLVPQMGGRPEPPANPTVVDPSVINAILETTIRTTGMPLSGRFVDANHGSLVLVRCASLPVDNTDGCTIRLVVTTDGTRFADRPTVPGGDSVADFPPSLWAFDDGALVYGHIGRRWVSNDAGLTWREVSTTPAGEVTTVPDDAKLVSIRPEEREAPIVLASDGTSYTLSTAPAGATDVQSNLAYLNGEAVDGSFFLTSGIDLLVSTDRGATWQPADTGDAVVTEILGSDGRRAYALANTERGGPPRLLMSEDHGLTWSTVPMPALTPVLGSTPGVYGEENVRTLSIAVVPTGGVLLTDTARVWRLPPDGTTFEPVADDHTAAVLGMSGAMLALRGDVTSTAFHVSSDGAQWRLATLG